MSVNCLSLCARKLTKLKKDGKGHNKYSVVSIIVNPAFVPITLKEMSPKTFYGVNVVLIKRANKSFVPGGTDSLLPDDTVYVVGTAKEIATFREAINGKRRKK